ncbi:MAG: nucleotidyltransferase family protein [Endomicrobia bacterium]|nr:nucleotidyltransferase family protein [Endomicrobiia bacterium]
MNKFMNVCVVILCGGRGKRLGVLTKNLPKPLLKVSGRPFIDYILDYLKSFGIKNIILAAGYKAEVIEKYFGQKDKGFEIFISKERQPLGTAGAIKFAEKYIKSDPFIVLNGDTFCNVNLKEVLRFHNFKHAEVTVVATKKMFDTTVSYGCLFIDENNKVVCFQEKKPHQTKQYINCGIYIFNKKILKFIPKNKKCSLEYDILPKIDNIFAYIVDIPFLDIGTPKRLIKAKNYLEKWRQ